MQPMFESSDTGSKVFLYEGEPQFLCFEVNGEKVEISLPNMIEIYRLFNGIWYGGLWRMLNICNSGWCSIQPTGGHIRTETCPQMTEYEKKAYDEYISNMRTMHMEANRPPIADGTTSDSPQLDNTTHSPTNQP